MTVADALRHGFRHAPAEADSRGSGGCLLSARDSIAVQSMASPGACTCRVRLDSLRHRGAVMLLHGAQRSNSPTHVSLLVLAKQLLRFEQVGEGTAAGHCTPNDHIGTCEVVQYPRGLICVCCADSYIQHTTCMCTNL